MILRFFKILKKCAAYEGTFSEKVSVFIILTKLQFKIRYFDSVNNIVDQNIFDFNISGYSYKTLSFLFAEVFLLNEYYFISNSANPVILDCGSNVGMSILYFKKMYPESRILAFEANPFVYKVLEDNIKKNNVKDVVCHNVALTDEQKEISFYIGDDIGTLEGSINETRGGRRVLKVKGQRLSNFIKSLGFVDLVKMDVEGSEFGILSDLIETNCIQMVNEYIIEYHHNVGGEKSKLSTFLSYFELNGFNYTIKANNISPNGFQDILIHCTKISFQ